MQNPIFPNLVEGTNVEGNVECGGFSNGQT